MAAVHINMVPAFGARVESECGRMQGSKKVWMPPNVARCNQIFKNYKDMMIYDWNWG